MNEPEREALHSTFHRLETRWHEGFDSGPYHAWDPLPFWLFLDGIRRCATLTEGRRFLDVGCGIGTKLALMFHLGWQVAGIDRYGPYVEAARELMPEATITHADAFDVTKFDADLVYAYRPMKADGDEDRLERHIVDRIAAGTVVFLPVRDVALLGLREVIPEVGVKV